MEPMAGAVWQAFAVILPVRTVGVMGDYGTYAYQVRQLGDMIEEFRLTPEDSSRNATPLSFSGPTRTAPGSPMFRT
jgi:GMP synthase C terminal domain